MKTRTGEVSEETPRRKKRPELAYNAPLQKENNHGGGELGLRKSLRRAKGLSRGKNGAIIKGYKSSLTNRAFTGGRGERKG